MKTTNYYNLTKNSHIEINEYTKTDYTINIHHYDKKMFISITDNELSYYSDYSPIYTTTTTRLLNKVLNILSISDTLKEQIKNLYKTRTSYYDCENNDIDHYEKNEIITQMTRG